MRVVLVLILLLHGIIHVFGFLKWSRITDVPQLTGRTLLPLSATAGQVFAILWLTTLVGFFIAATLYVTRHDLWWVLALSSGILSQLLIVIAWSDAKFGTIANVLILIPALAAGAHARFERTVATEARAMLAAGGDPQSSIVRQEELQALPAPVRRWLEVSGVVGQPRARAVRLKQRGQLRISPEAPWMPARAEQYFAVDDPAFVWRVDTTLLHFLPFAGRDSYSAGKGHMLIKAASVLNVVDAKDEKVVHGSLLRYLAEIIWFPSAALSPLIEWDAVDAASAKATLRHGGRVAVGLFLFDDLGRYRGLRAERYLGGGEEAKLTPWVASTSKWQQMEGIEVPTQGEVSWELPGGRFTYYRWEILDVQYNRSQLYGEDEGRDPSLLSQIDELAVPGQRPQ